MFTHRAKERNSKGSEAKANKSVFSVLRAADNVALPAFAAAARLPLTAVRAAIDRYLLAAGPTAANPLQQRAAAE